MSRLPGVGGHSLTSLVPGSEGGEKEKPAAFGLLHGGGAPEELGPVSRDMALLSSIPESYTIFPR
jgi:hypothetical protein